MKALRTLTEATRVLLKARDAYLIALEDPALIEEVGERDYRELVSAGLDLLRPAEAKKSEPQPVKVEVSLTGLLPAPVVHVDALPAGPPVVHVLNPEPHATITTTTLERDGHGELKASRSVCTPVK